MPSPLHLFSRRLLIVLALLVSAFAFSNPALATRATPQSSVTVSDDSLKVYSDATAESSLVTTLTKNAPVTVRLRISNSEGAWCKIEMKAQQDQVNAGFVHCSGLSGNLQPQPKNSSDLQEGSPQTSASGNSIPPCVDSPAPRKLQGSDRIYFVPFGNFPLPILDYLRDCFQRRYGLDIKILPAIDIESSALDPNRQQFVAERLIAEAEQKYSRFAARPGVALISFTEEDMYPVSVDWGWVFGFHIGRSGVISTARFDEPFDGSPAGQAAVLSRLRRVTGRYLAFLHYHLPPNNNPKSLLYYSVMSVEELDALPEDF